LLDGGAGPEKGRATGQAPDVRFRVVEEIVDLVEVVSAGSAVVVALEDLQWADASTILAFRSMVHRLAHLPVLLGRVP
jgi:predicted ATPase